MNKKLIIIITVVLIIGLGVVGYIYWQKSKTPELTPEEQVLKQAGEAAEAITKSATQGTLPSMDVKTNPLGETPDINPAGQANPFKDIKTNPFR